MTEKPLQTDCQKLLGVEFFSFLRTGANIRVEFDNSDELRKYREAYILHVLDYVLQDRERVAYNDKKIFEEQNQGRVTLDNVFSLA